MTLQDACQAYLRDIEARHLRASTRDNYKSLFRAWQTYADARDFIALNDWNQAQMRTWRESWECEPGTQLRRLKQLRAFFSFAVRAGWVYVSPVKHLKAPKAPPKPTMPLSRHEIQALFAVAAKKPKEQALLLLMRYSGLSIRDAVTLRREAIDGHLLTLRRSKSGELVIVYLPARVLVSLDRVVRPNGMHYFWSGTSESQTAAKYWRSRLNLIAREAGVKDFRPHRLRDTFAVEFLLAGVAMQDVSTLLGHSSVITTERYYAPWNVSRRDRLVRIVREVYECDPLLQSLDGRSPDNNKTGAAPTAPANSSAPIPAPNSSQTRMSIARS